MGAEFFLQGGITRVSGKWKSLRGVQRRSQGWSHMGQSPQTLTTKHADFVSCTSTSSIGRKEEFYCTTLNQIYQSQHVPIVTHNCDRLQMRMKQLCMA